MVTQSDLLSSVHQLYATIQLTRPIYKQCRCNAAYEEKIDVMGSTSTQKSSTRFGYIENLGAAERMTHSGKA